MAKRQADNAAFQALKQDLKEGHLGQCYLFYGEEQYLLRRYVAQVRSALVNPGMEEFNYHHFSGKDLDLNDLWNAVDALPVMAQRTLVEVTDLDLFRANEGQKERLMELLGDLPEYLCLLFVYDQLEFKTGPKSKYSDFLKQHIRLVEFQPRTAGDLNDWIRREFAALDRDIDRQEAEYLVFLCGGLMEGLSGEIQKIASYAKARRITRADIDAVADPVLDARVFQMTDDISTGQYEKAMGVLGDLYALGQSPIMVLAVVGKYLRQLFTARLALESGRGTQTLMEAWGMKTDWQARKLMQTARRYDLDWCRRSLRLAEETDRKMKSTGLDQEQLLTELMLRLARG